MSELKPCPFCGGEAHRVDLPERNGVAIECVKCHAGTTVWVHAMDDAYPEAVDSWNRRPPVDSVAVDIKEAICQAHMAGQFSAGCAEPSWSEAHTHYTYKAKPALSDSTGEGDK